MMLLEEPARLLAIGAANLEWGGEVLEQLIHQEKC